MTASTKSAQKSARTASNAPCAMPTPNPALARMWTELFNETSRFMSERLRADMEMQSAFLTSTTPAELLTRQTAFVQTAVQHYAESGQRVLAIMTDAARETGTVNGTSRGYDDVPV